MITIDEMMYELWLADTPYRHEPTARMVREFLGAHGINVFAGRVPEDACIRVTRNDDGTFQFSCKIHRADHPICEDCQSCILQEEVNVPLAAAVPVIPGGRFWPKVVDSLPRVLPEDPQAMLEAAERFYLDRHADDVSRSVDRLRGRRDRLTKFSAAATVQAVNA